MTKMNEAPCELCPTKVMCVNQLRQNIRERSIDISILQMKCPMFEDFTYDNSRLTVRLYLQEVLNMSNEEMNRKLILSTSGVTYYMEKKE